ncbi:MAG: hypothetical protein LBI17_00085 [Rickettsiales bacterium]|jgi:hypothetical protein|nr:hypothetical protein [Rickettsiales bacterium]
MNKEQALKRMDELEIIGIFDCGHSPEDVQRTLKGVEEYDKKWPIESEVKRMEQIRIARGLSSRPYG